MGNKLFNIEVGGKTIETEGFDMEVGVSPKITISMRTDNIFSWMYDGVNNQLIVVRKDKAIFVFQEPTEELLNMLGGSDV